MRRRAASRVSPMDWEWAADFSIDKYRPMQRLLSEDDCVFLKSQPGYHPSMLQTLRKDRRRVCRAYLRSLYLDFDRLYWAAKEAVIFSHANELGLLRMIVRQRTVFLWALSMVEVRLALHALGVGTVDLRPVLGSLEAMRDAARILQPVPA
jgi:hypothetical protein